MDNEHQAEFEIRRRLAIAQLDVTIDVLSAWRGRYEDDDAPATIAWIMALIPEMSADPRRGWLCVRDSDTPGIGWEFRGGRFCLSSLCHSLRGIPWPVTRQQFRAAALASGVSLPVGHATLYLVLKD